MKNGSCLFGSQDYSGRQVNVLGTLCGIDKYKVGVLSDSQRNFLSRVTDILLVDPFGRVANAMGIKVNLFQRVNEMTSDGRMVDAYKRAANAEKDIFNRKVTTVLLAAFVAMVSYLHC